MRRSRDTPRAGRPEAAAGPADSNEWVNRTRIKSETSDRVYVVAQHATKRYWGCSCPGWRSHRKCKHLERLGLPNDERPFEVPKDHAARKNFLAGYPTYDATAGRGNAADWQQAFSARLGLADARAELKLPAAAGWDDVRKAFHLAGAEAVRTLIAEFEAAAERFRGDSAAEAEAVRRARFRLLAYAEYLSEQKRKLEVAADRITGRLVGRLRAIPLGGRS